MDKETEPIILKWDKKTKYILLLVIAIVCNIDLISGDAIIRQLALAFLPFEFISAFIVGWVAHERGRDPIIWGVFGFCLPVISLIVLVCVPIKKKLKDDN